MRPTLIENKQFMLLDRATMKCCSHYLRGDNKGKPTVYELKELEGAKKVLWDHHGIEAVEREIKTGGEK